MTHRASGETAGQGAGGHGPADGQQPSQRPIDGWREAAREAACRERERFKRDVNLLAYAASRGYVFNKAKSSVNFPALRHPTTGHKMLVGKGQDGHWLFFSVSSPESGSIVDFIQYLEGGRNVYPITQVLRELREWTNTPRELPEMARTNVVHVPKDRAAVAATVEHGRSVQAHPYLESRGLSRETLQHPRFRSTWLESGERREERDLPAGTVLFLHKDRGGLSGFETKHWRFTGFAKGGTKALWSSLAKPTDNRLVVTESALDALSYHQINPHPRTRYVSFAGALNHTQPRLLENAISWMPAGSTIVAATDRDADGDKFARLIADLCKAHPQVSYERHAPERVQLPNGQLGKDWNDQLQALRIRSVLREPSPHPGLGR